jgi:D-sedoheptulose 7-phosphate isomerase
LKIALYILQQIGVEDYHMEDRVDSIFKEASELHAKLSNLAPIISKAAGVMIDCIKKGGKIMFAGNGGSAADSQHLAAELIGRFMKERNPIAGIALTTNTSIISAVANDYAYDDIFSRQVEGLGRPGDVFFGISTSGNSPNILKAMEAAKSGRIITIGLTGNGGGKMAHAVDCLIDVPYEGKSARIQEVHILIGHILCELIEDAVLSV